MRIRIIWLVTLFMVANIFSLAVPKIEVYRYVGRDFKTLPLDLLTNTQINLTNWVIDTDAWPKGKNIALLVHGFPLFNEGNNRNGLLALAENLSHDRKIGNTIIPTYDAVYAVEYPSKYDVMEMADALIKVINNRCLNFAAEEKIDVFAHSYGGLVVRTALEFSKAKSNIINRINHVVFMGTPHNGFYIPEFDIIKQVIGEMPVEIQCLNPDFPSFITILNYVDNKKVKIPCAYYSIIGVKSDYPEKYAKSMVGPFTDVVKKMQDIQFRVHDGLINVESAGFDLSPYCQSFKKVPLNLNHDFIKSHQETFDVIDKWMADDKWFTVANVKVLKDCFSDLYAVRRKIKLNKPLVIGRVGGESVLSINELPNFTEDEASKADANLIDYYVVFRRPPGFPSSLDSIVFKFREFADGEKGSNLPIIVINLKPNWQYAWYNVRRILNKPGNYEVILDDLEGTVINKKFVMP